MRRRPGRIKQGQSLIDGQDLEIWQGKRLVTYLVPEFFAGEMQSDRAPEGLAAAR